MIIAATGHRPPKLGGYNNRRLDQFAVETVNRLSIASSSPLSFISGMALGWDQAIAKACIHYHIPFTAAVPFNGQELKWPADSQVMYHHLLTRARAINILSTHYDGTIMQRRNEWMVDHADTVLALWDGSPGGTANCVGYAQGKKPIINEWPEWQKFNA